MANDIGSRVKRVREAKGHTQSSLTDAIKASGEHVEKNTISRIEQGDTKNPKVLTMAAIAKELGVSIDFLVTGKDPLSDQTEQRVQLVRESPLFKAVVKYKKPPEPVMHEAAKILQGMPYDVDRHHVDLAFVLAEAVVGSKA